MNIWIINNYSMLPEHGPMSRTYNFVKFLNKKGHNAIGFGASYPHNTDLQLITDNKKYVKWDSEVPWVYVKTCNYKGSMFKRIYAMWQFYHNTKQAVKEFGTPDAIIGSSAPPTDMLLAIKLARKYKCKAITEVRDLWPESLVSYEVISKYSFITLLMRVFEKWAYRSADACIFTMKGYYKYLVEHNWQNEISTKKCFYINNGVDLAQFEYNLINYNYKDEWLDNIELFKVVYTGSIRQVNDVGFILDIAKKLNSRNIKFLIFGTGNECTKLKNRIIYEDIKNVKFMGPVEKHYIPSILEKADLTIDHFAVKSVSKYGISHNKIFDYFASAKPVLYDFSTEYNPVKEYGAGIFIPYRDSDFASKEIDNLSKKGDQYYKICNNSHNAAKEFDYDILTQKLIEVLEGINE